MQYKLTIAIPTYNRAGKLKKMRRMYFAAN